jgi:DNA-binding CsgD family transcriptional regulator
MKFDATKAAKVPALIGIGHDAPPARAWTLLLVTFVAISVYGNTAHALLTGHDWAAAGWFAVAPVALFWVTHLVAKTAGRSPKGAVKWLVWLVGIPAALTVAGMAFVVSFRALRAWTLHQGGDDLSSFLLPLIVDVIIALSSMMVLAMRPSSAAPQPAKQVAEPVRVTPAMHDPAASMTQPLHDAVARRDPHEIPIAPPAYSAAVHRGDAPVARRDDSAPVRVTTQVPDAVTRPETAPEAHPRQDDAPEGGAAVTQPVTCDDAVTHQDGAAVAQYGDAADPADVAQLDTPDAPRPDPASDGAVARSGDPDHDAADPVPDNAVTQPLARIDDATGDPDHDGPDAAGGADSDEVVARSGDASDDAPVARRLAAVPAPPKLSKRDAEILRRTIAGESAQTIAYAMKVSKSTALRHIRRLRADAGLPPVEASA